jgi:DNA polymerase-3 subunit beta
MKVTVQQKKLQQALRIVEKIVSRNVSLPILNNILIKTENGRLKLATTNLEIGITCFIGAKIAETGEIAVPARIMAPFMGSVSEDTVSLTTKANSLLINTGAYKTQILGSDTKDYPIIPKIKSDPVCTIPAAMLHKSLTSVVDSIAVFETRPELAGLFVRFSGNKITLASTDSFRLTEKKVSFTHKDKHSVIIPRNTIGELIRITNEIQGDLGVRIEDNQISFSNNDVVIVSRLVDGSYPDYTKVIPEKFVSKALIKTSELEKSIRLAGLFSSNIADIKLKCTEDKIHITAKNTDKGEIQAAVPVVLKNNPFELSLNFNYLLDGLKVINSEKTVIEFTGDGSPLILRPSDEKNDIVYLIMPLRS